MENLIVGVIILVAVFLVAQSFILLNLLKQAVNRFAEVNKQLLIVVAGKESKPESTLRALVASTKPPQKKIPGIADRKKKDEKPKNTDYQMKIGIG